MNSSDPDGMLLESITPAEPSSALFALLSGLASVSSEICACGVALSRASDAPGTLSSSPASPAPCSSKESTSWVPTNCTIAGTAGTSVHDGRVWAEATATAIAAGASLQFLPPMGIWSGAANPAIAIAAGSTYGFELDAYVQTTDGSLLPAAWYPDFRINLQNNAGGRYVIDLGNPSVYPDTDYGTPAYQIHCASPEWTATESTATLVNSSQWFIKMILPAGPAGYKMGVANPRIVKIR